MCVDFCTALKFFYDIIKKNCQQNDYLHLLLGVLYGIIGVYLTQYICLDVFESYMCSYLFWQASCLWFSDHLLSMVCV